MRVGEEEIDTELKNSILELYDIKESQANMLVNYANSVLAKTDSSNIRAVFNISLSVEILAKILQDNKGINFSMADKSRKITRTVQFDEDDEAKVSLALICFTKNGYVDEVFVNRCANRIMEDIVRKNAISIYSEDPIVDEIITIEDRDQPMFYSFRLKYELGFAHI